MGVSKVEYAGNTIIDLTGDTVSESNLLAGATAHNAMGDVIVGTATLERPGVNLLHNADWAYSLVNQRGHSGAVSNAYCIDRWIGKGNVTPVSGQYVTLASGTTMTQRMEIIPDALFGKICTFSIDVGGTVQTATIRFPTAAGNAPNTASVLSGTVEFGFVSGSFKLCDVDCAAVPYVKFTAAADINVRRVFLELGEVSHMVGTAMRDFGENLMVCQRYDTDLSTGGGIIVGMGMSVTSKMARILCSLPTSMRVRPSLETEDLSGLMLRISGVNPAPSAISVFGNSSDTFITFNVTVSDNIESNQPCALINNAGAKIRLSARL